MKNNLSPTLKTYRVHLSRGPIRGYFGFVPSLLWFVLWLSLEAVDLALFLECLADMLLALHMVPAPKTGIEGQIIKS